MNFPPVNAGYRPLLSGSDIIEGGSLTCARRGEITVRGTVIRLIVTLVTGKSSPAAQPRR